jgi:predicted ester cyclase
MSPNENKHIIRQYVEVVVNTGKVDKLQRFISPEYVEAYEGKRYPLGIKGAEEHIQSVRQTYPDLTITIERQIAEGEWVATCYVARGTHRGEWMGIKPTGKVLTYSGVNVDRVVDGRIAEHGGAANMLGPLLDAEAVRVVGQW